MGCRQRSAELFLSLNWQRPQPNHSSMRRLFSLEFRSFTFVKALQDGPYTRHIQQVRFLVCKFGVRLTFYFWVGGGNCNRVKCDIHRKTVRCCNLGNTNKCTILQSLCFFLLLSSYMFRHCR